jgi:selenide, water dikinase
MDDRKGDDMTGETSTAGQIRLTQTAPGGGCSCKIAPGDLEALLERVSDGRVSAGPAGFELLSGSEQGDDAAVVRIEAGRAVVATTDFFTPVVDDPFEWGRIAAVNALSDIYAMGGEPLVALNLLAWPVDVLDNDLAAEVLRGGRSATDEAGCFLAGGHSIVDETPKYGLAVTGLADPDHLLRNDCARPGEPISLTKPLGVGVLNNRHKATGEWFADAVAAMGTLNRDASRAALAAGITAATDVTGFGLLGHLYKMARASGVAAVVDAAAVPYLDGSRAAVAAGFIPGGSTRNLEWVRPHLDSDVDEDELLLLADAQTSGGLLLAGEIPGATVIGYFAELSGPALTVRGSR